MGVLVRRFYDPLTIAAAAMTALGSISAGNAANAAAQAEANTLDLERMQEQKQSGRDQRDLAREKSRSLARTRAVLAATGGDTTSGTALALLGSQGAAFDIEGTRMLDDSAARQSSLRVRAANTRTFGKQKRNEGFFTAAGQMAFGAHKAGVKLPSFFKSGASAPPGFSGAVGANNAGRMI